MNNIEQRVLIILITLGFLGHGYCDDINIPEGAQLERCLGLVMHSYVTDNNLQKCGINKKLIDWTETDFELLQAALNKEVTTNTKRYSTDAADIYLKDIAKGIDVMKKMQLEDRQQLAKEGQQNEVFDKVRKLQARIEPFLKKAYSGAYSSDDVLSSNELAQIKAVEIEYKEVEAYAKLHDIHFPDSLGQDLAKIQEHQNEAMAFHAESELEKQKSKQAKKIAFVAASASFLASIVIYLALHRRKVNQLKSRIELLTRLEDGSTLAEEKQVLDTKVKLRDSKWKPFRSEIIEHLIEENKSIITGDARATISELVALRIGDGVQDFQSFLPPSVRLPASHYAPFLFTEEDVERFEAEQKNIANLLEEQLEPDYENETVVWVCNGE